MNGVHQHPFGTTSVRTVPLVKKDALYMPGPARYPQSSLSEELDPEGTQPVRPIQVPKKSSMFSSTSKRLYSPPAIMTVSSSVYTTLLYFVRAISSSKVKLI